MIEPSDIVLGERGGGVAYSFGFQKLAGALVLAGALINPLGQISICKTGILLF